MSKTAYMRYLKHPAWGWLYVNDRPSLPPVNEVLQERFDSGNKFEAYAEIVFPDAVHIDFDPYDTMPERTKTALDDGAQIILQGRFVHEGLTCIIDVLVRVAGDEFDLYEIKSSTKVKDEHKEELAFQTVVLDGLGYKIRNKGVIYVNKEYVRDGDIDPDGITKSEDVTEDVNLLLEGTPERIEAALKTIKLSECPDMSPRYVNGDKKYWMEVYNYVVRPDPDSIYSLTRIGKAQMAELESLGTETVEAIPDDFRLTPTQRPQVSVAKSGERLIVNKDIDAFLQGLEYPLHFLDYESFHPAIPAFDGLKPYEHIPFQYVVYVVEKPGAEPELREYLHSEATNPLKPLVESLRGHIGDTGSIIVWFQRFEKTCNETLAMHYPEQADFLLGMNDRIVDLMIPFSSGAFVDKEFHGSASIKSVLPALSEGRSYKDLGIGDGELAGVRWAKAVLNDDSEVDRDEVFADLRKYCGQDTIGMHEILGVLLSV